MSDDQRQTGIRTVPIPSSAAEQKLRDLYNQALEKKRTSLLVYHRDGAEIVPLQPGIPVVVGRSSAADIVVRDSSLSREHARFELIDDAVWIEDLGSTNGTLVNGERINRGPVSSTDKIVVGAVPISIHCLASAECGLYGLDSHDSFCTILEQEVVRSGGVGHSFALLVVRAARDPGMDRWCPRVRRVLRRFDRIALYSHDAIEILLPEMTAEEATQLAQTIVEDREAGEPVLVCGAALYPDAGVTANELIDVATAAALDADEEQPLCWAPQRGRRTLEPGEVADAERSVVESRVMVDLYRTVDRVAKSVIPVLICGETGSGKEIVARAIHERGPRRGRPMCCVNCGAISKGLVESTLFGHERGAFTGAVQRAKGVFEAADGGTVMLDELGELPPEAQAALLRVLETRQICRVGSSKAFEVDVRIVAATNRDLEQMCAANDFRWDLYYRLNAITLRVPPLRDRSEEIVPLARHFMVEANRSNNRQVRGISEAAEQLLTRYPWPGNVRELKNTIARAVVIAEGTTIEVEDLPRRVRSPAGQSEAEGPGDDSASSVAPTPDPDPMEPGKELKAHVREFEAKLIVSALERNDWNAGKAAKQLGLPLRTLYHKMSQHNIAKPEKGS